MYLINTFLGFLITALSDTLKRDKKSEHSPERFSLSFFVKDNWEKWVVSLMLSIVLSIALHLNIKDFAQLFGKEWTVLNQIVYIVIGIAPELVLQRLKKKTGLFQPDEVDGYKRN